MLVYPTMVDETIAVYRTRPGDRWIPWGAFVILALTVPLWVAFSGPFLWPWGVLAAFFTALASLLYAYRWWQACGEVRWNESSGQIGYRRGRTSLVVPWTALTSIKVRPSAATTLVRAGRRRFRFSHRVLGSDELLFRLREARPDLFFDSATRLVFRRSLSSAAFQLGMAAGTGGSAFLLALWVPGLGLVFGAASLYVFFRILFFVPRVSIVTEGCLTTVYWLRSKRWGRPAAVWDEGYSSDGAGFYRMVLDYGRWKVALDESELRDWLRPSAGTVVQLLLRPPSD